KKDAMFYTMVVFSFNNAIRFNDKGLYNQSCNKRDFNRNIRKSLEGYAGKLKESNIEFTNFDFREFDIEKLTSDDLVYCDPPYFISGVAYNENNHGWNKKDELDLYEFLDALDSRRVKFAFSNIAKNKGKENEILIEWASKYNV